MRGVHFLIGSLTCKMMALTFAIGLCTWGALDYVQGRQLKAIFNRQIAGELEVQGKDARLHFDDYVARYQKAARIFVSQTSFSDYLSRRIFRTERGVKLYTVLPPWMLGPSVIRALVRIRYAVLLDGNGNVKELYQEDSGLLPPALLHPNNLLLRLSYNQSLLTNVDNVPFVVTAAPFLGRGGRIRAVLMLASPIDDDFLMSSQPSNGVLTVLADPGKKIIVASNRPDSLPDGTSLAEVRQNYHVTGQSFFDAGSSDLLLNFISLVPNAQYGMLGKAVVLAERQQKAIMVFILISAFALIMLWITGRVGRLTGQIIEFSENVLHRKPQGLAGDELGILEKQFKRLTEEITTYQDVILRNYHFQRAISSILRISLEPLYSEDKWELIIDSVLSLPFVSGRPIGCCLYLVEDDPGVLVMKVHRGYPETVPDSCRAVPIDGKGLYAPAVASRRPVFAGPSDGGHAGMCCGALAPHAHYFVPMVSSGKTLGVLDIFLEQDHQRDHEEEAMLSSAADTLVQIRERDNAEREKQGLQRQLSQAEKLSALGRLTANVAHEIRNPLTSIGGFAKRLGKKLSPGTEENEFAGIIASEAGNLERILRSVLSYSREARLVLEPKDMNALVEECLRTFGEMIVSSGVEVKKFFADLPQVMIDGFQVKEALNNFILNAIEAMREGGGTLSLSTRKEVFRDIQYLILEIADTGAGIPENKAAMIFEPFFTTKTLGRGTGLGLPISKKIVEDHGGFICFDSQEGRGTAFRLHFPLGGPSAGGAGNKELKVRCSIRTIQGT